MNYFVSHQTHRKQMASQNTTESFPKVYVRETIKVSVVFRASNLPLCLKGQVKKAVTDTQKEID